MTVDQLTVDRLQADVGTWGEATFPEATVASIYRHLEEELQELAVAIFRNEGIGEECADIHLLLLHLAHRSGFSLHDAAVVKFALVKGQWFEMTDKGYRKRVKAPAGSPAPGGGGGVVSDPIVEKVKRDTVVRNASALVTLIAEAHRDELLGAMTQWEREGRVHALISDPREYDHAGVLRQALAMANATAQAIRERLRDQPMTQQDIDAEIGAAGAAIQPCEEHIVCDEFMHISDEIDRYFREADGHDPMTRTKERAYYVRIAALAQAGIAALDREHEGDAS